ncbi:lysophospholipase [Porticoccaceae bacterium]|nr:lysophospholipase [Porticoccaceae bacterium]MDC0011250.1 lysophospholipase [Porticoccaceae bacterium]MDC1452758.1 lysophospholipase [Porticoccaceae bacterium]
MNLKTIAFNTGQPGDCYYHEWSVQAPQQPRAWVHIIHGMAEHSARYADLATYLNQQGFHVTADDHRGHGKTAEANNNLYHFADSDGWNQMVDDQLQLIEHIGGDHTLPLIILGHSMGSFLAMHTCQRYADKLSSRLKGLVLSGSNYAPPWFCSTASQIARIERARLGGSSVSKLLETMSFGAFNNAFKPVRTEKDWISSDPETVDLYLADPHCGGAISTQSWYDFLRGLADLSAPAAMARIKSDLPIYVFSGALDPVGGAGKGVKKLEAMLKSVGVQQVSCRLYDGGHHEMLNETNKTEVYQDLLSWLDSLEI